MSASDTIAIVFPGVFLPPSAVLDPSMYSKHLRNELRRVSTTVLLIYSPFNRRSQAFFITRPA